MKCSKAALPQPEIEGNRYIDKGRSRDVVYLGHIPLAWQPPTRGMSQVRRPSLGHEGFKLDIPALGTCTGKMSSHNI